MALVLVAIGVIAICWLVLRSVRAGSVRVELESDETDRPGSSSGER
ncbi:MULTISPECIES: hypothetical protein [unclassified Nocardia]|nr:MULTISPECIES: hypothetical protein [unclassified Nocardia]